MLMVQQQSSGIHKTDHKLSIQQSKDFEEISLYKDGD